MRRSSFSPPSGPRLGHRRAAVKLEQLLPHPRPPEGAVKSGVDPTGDKSSTADTTRAATPVVKGDPNIRRTPESAAPVARIIGIVPADRRNHNIWVRPAECRAPACRSVANVTDHLRQALFGRAGAPYLGAERDGGWPDCSLENCRSLFVEDGPGARWVCRDGMVEFATTGCPWRRRRR
jgi:hypothetical protein